MRNCQERELPVSVDPKQASNSRFNTGMKASWFKGHIKFDISYLNTNLFLYIDLYIIEL
jgi:hypothetical protein